MDYVCGLNSPPEPLNSPPEPLNSPPRRATARLARVVRVVRVSRMLKLYQHYLKHFGGKKPVHSKVRIITLNQCRGGVEGV